jgi:hypothetical protein
MVDITIFELHLDDTDLSVPWETAADSVEVDDGGGPPVGLLALTGLVVLAGLGLGLFVRRRRRGGDSAV